MSLKHFATPLISRHNNGTESRKRTGKIAGSNRKRFKQAARSDVADPTMKGLLNEK
jgi:hypothetical protein